MIQSHVIDIKGTFAGAAVGSINTFRFIAVHPRVKELDGSEWPTLQDLRRAVGHLLVTGRLPARAVRGVETAAAVRPAMGRVGPHTSP
jgi:hypothetical protein